MSETNFLNKQKPFESKNLKNNYMERIYLESLIDDFGMIEVTPLPKEELDMGEIIETFGEVIVKVA